MKKAKRYRVWQDGRFMVSPRPGAFCIIKTEKIFGRLDCSSGRGKAKRENRVFAHSWKDALTYGARPCKVCKPHEDDGYIQCLGCGECIFRDTGRAGRICRCSQLAFDGDTSEVRIMNARAGFRILGMTPPIRRMNMANE